MLVVLLIADCASTFKDKAVESVVLYPGGLFELSGGFVCKLRWQRTKGALLREPGKDMKPEDIRDNWNAIVNWDETEILNVIICYCVKLYFTLFRYNKKISSNLSVFSDSNICIN